MVNSFLSKCCIFFVLVIGVLGLGKGYHYLTAGFWYGKIQVDMRGCESWKVAKPEEEKLGPIREILSQNFYYFSKGRQTYVFLSEDGNYVLKLIRYSLLRPSFWSPLWKFTFGGEKRWERKVFGRERKFVFFMNSYYLAYTDLKEETGLIFSHLTPTDYLKQSVTLYDGVGRRYSFALDERGFVLQKKFDSLEKRVKSLVKNKSWSELDGLIDSYVTMIASRRAKGIRNKDHRWVNNCGVTGEKVCEIDVGSFYKPETKLDLKSFSCEMQGCTREFRQWLEQNLPDWVERFDEKVEKITAQYKQITAEG